MKSISISEALKKGWQLTKSHYGFLISSAGIYLVLSIVSNIISHLAQHAHSATEFLLGVCLILIGVLTLLFDIGIIRSILDIYDGGHPKVGDLFSHTEFFWRFFLVALLFGAIGAAFSLVAMLILFISVFLSLHFFISSVLYILLIVVVIALMVCGATLFLRLSLASIVLIDLNTGTIEAFKKSMEITKGHVWKLIGFGIVFILLNIVGALVLVVGLFVTIPVTLLAYITLYRSLQNTPKNAIS